MGEYRNVTDSKTESTANDQDDAPDVMRQQVPVSMAGQRLDRVLVNLFDEYSRSRLQKWLADGEIKVEGQAIRARDKVIGGEWINLQVPQAADDAWIPQDIPLDVIYEDDTILVINKPAGMVVHPAAGNRDGTLLNGLLYYAPELMTVPRAGIVHRLDKDTTGLLVIARTLKAHKNLVDQLKERTVKREYSALVSGVIVVGDTIEQAIGRHTTDRKKMAVKFLGKEAITHYRIAQRYRAHTLLQVNLETGRTHQIRVHMAWMRHPVVGDKMYGSRSRLPQAAEQDVIDVLQQFPRQALHAHRLGLDHPETGEAVAWEAPMPDDMAHMLDLLRQDFEQHEET